MLILGIAASAQPNFTFLWAPTHHPALCETRDRWNNSATLVSQRWATSSGSKVASLCFGHILLTASPALCNVSCTHMWVHETSTLLHFQNIPMTSHQSTGYYKEGETFLIIQVGERAIKHTETCLLTSSLQALHVWDWITEPVVSGSRWAEWCDGVSQVVLWKADPFFLAPLSWWWGFLQRQRTCRKKLHRHVNTLAIMDVFIVWYFFSVW